MTLTRHKNYDFVASMVADAGVFVGRGWKVVTVRVGCAVIVVNIPLKSNGFCLLSGVPIPSMGKSPERVLL